MNVNASGKQVDKLFKNVLDNVNDGVTLIDNTLKIQYQNRTVVQLFGSKIGEYCYEAYRSRKKPCDDCLVIEVLKDGRERRGIRDIKLPGGGLVLVEISSAAIRDIDGEIIGAVEVARDVTDQKKAEAVLNKTLIESNEVLKKLNKELSNAEGYVKTVLPRKISSGSLQTDWQFIPSVSLGGDSFGYHWIDEDHFALYLIDVSGHGWAAAILSVSVINVLRSHALPSTDFHKPVEVLSALNSTFPSERHNDMFFTIWYGVYCKSTHQLVYASGGHPPALLFSGFGLEKVEVEQLRTPNFIVGGEKDTVYQSRSQKILTPARLLVFSDGVFDITKEDGSIWGLNGFLEYLEQYPGTDKSMLDSLLAYTRALTKKEKFEDDYSILKICIY